METYYLVKNKRDGLHTGGKTRFKSEVEAAVHLGDWYGLNGIHNGWTVYKVNETIHDNRLEIQVYRGNYKYTARLYRWDRCLVVELPDAQ